MTRRPCRPTSAKKRRRARLCTPGGCPGSRMRSIRREEAAQPQTAVPQPSQLGQWPCQIKLVPVNAPYFQGAKLLIAARLHGVCLREYAQ